MSVKNLIESVRQRIVYAKMVINESDNLWSCEQTLYALSHDKGSALPGSATDSFINNHYQFGVANDMSIDELSDFVAAKVGHALKKSKKAMAITFCHGSITDKGMIAFLKGLEATQAPIKALHFIDLQDVSDKSLSVLPEIIEKKGITLCEIWACGVSQDLEKRINLACKKNQNIKMSNNKSLMYK